MFVPLPSHPYSFYLLNNIWCAVQIINIKTDTRAAPKQSKLYDTCQ
jgi:hypothetical protein